MENNRVNQKGHVYIIPSMPAALVYNSLTSGHSIHSVLSLDMRAAHLAVSARSVAPHAALAHRDVLLAQETVTKLRNMMFISDSNPMLVLSCLGHETEEEWAGVMALLDGAVPGLEHMKRVTCVITGNATSIPHHYYASRAEKNRAEKNKSSIQEKQQKVKK